MPTLHGCGAVGARFIPVFAGRIRAECPSGRRGRGVGPRPPQFGRYNGAPQARWSPDVLLGPVTAFGWPSDPGAIQMWAQKRGAPPSMSWRGPTWPARPRLPISRLPLAAKAVSHLSKKSIRRTGYPASPHFLESAVTRTDQDADFLLISTFGGERISTPERGGSARGVPNYFAEFPAVHIFSTTGTRLSPGTPGYPPRRPQPGPQISSGPAVSRGPGLLRTGGRRPAGGPGARQAGLR